MEQQIQQPNQQLNQPSSDETKRVKSRIIKIVLIAFGAILLIVGGIIVWLGPYSDLFDTRGKLNEKIQRNFPIQAEEQTCIVDADCAAVYADCSYCRCTAVNKQYEPKYQRSQQCENYEGVLCDFDCFPERQVAKCLNEHCVLSSEQPTGIIDVPTDWQTYRNAERGFEVKFPSAWIFEVIEEAVIFRDPQTDYTYSELSILPIGEILEETEQEVRDSYGFFLKDGQYFARDGLTEGSLADEEIVNGMNVLVANIPIRVYDREGNYTGIGEGKRVLISDNNKYALLDSSLLDDELFDQILSTFRFAPTP